jgi:hypothetical protein
VLGQAVGQKGQRGAIAGILCARTHTGEGQIAVGKKANAPGQSIAARPRACAACLQGQLLQHAAARRRIRGRQHLPAASGVQIDYT